MNNGTGSSRGGANSIDRRPLLLDDQLCSINSDPDNQRDITEENEDEEEDLEK